MNEERYKTTVDKVNEILSRALYWNEVNKRENSSDILRSELNDVVRSLGICTLWILEDWAKTTKETIEKIDKECPMKGRMCQCSSKENCIHK